ncbi:BDR-repeat family protein (plasmid) [Borrelia hermsii YBT]|uniref:BDR-repeat family protein n=1 Tax=Borrelia hermsii YBT TaxID=1313295 RepID=W5T2E9_BORHE|nr:Bdr family repetitive protein [Borrelia hermsii]AHH13407.1 BDR-repeat family protein [Borrelia hermsii YBT]
MGLPQPIVTQQMVIAELTKAGIDRDIATDLSYRYYRNELTYKDIEYLETTFNLKLEKIEVSLKSDIKDLDNKIDTVENNLNIKIDNVRNELKSDIKDLDTKIDTKFNELDNKINTVENNLNIKIDNVRNELKSDIKDLDTKIDVNKMELKSTLRLHNWMFGTIITISIGILLTLIFK